MLKKKETIRMEILSGAGACMVIFEHDFGQLFGT